MKVLIGTVQEYTQTIPQIFEEKLAKRHPARINEFISARLLLLRALESLKLEATLEELEQVDHQTLKNFPELTFSLSHTKTLVATVIASKKEHAYLGIDIESKDRQISPKVADYLNHPEDDIEFGLVKWVIKEAAFKYFSCKHKNENFWLKSLRIKSNKVFFEDDFCLYEVHETEAYYYAITYCEEEH